MQKCVERKNNSMKVMLLLGAATMALALFYGLVDTSVAEAAFGKINVGGKGVGGGKSLDEGLFKDMNTILLIVLSIAGFMVVACLIFAGVKLATAQGNPQNRTQGFIGLGMAILGGWVVYKALDLAGWIKGISGT